MANAITDLGTGTNPWRNIVSRNFYSYSTSPAYHLASTTLEKGVQPTEHLPSYVAIWEDKHNIIMGYSRFVEYNSGVQTFEINLENKATNGALDPNGSSCGTTLQLLL